MLSFKTEPLTEDIAVVGPVTVTLHVTTDGPDTDFTANLIDTHPPSADYPAGFALILTDDIFCSRYRKSFEQPEPCVPGEVMEIIIEPFATANLFKASHRIRLDISSSQFPKYDITPNTGAPEGTGRTQRVALNGVLVNATHSSHISLSVIRQYGC